MFVNLSSFTSLWEGKTDSSEKWPNFEGGCFSALCCGAARPRGGGGLVRGLSWHVAGGLCGSRDWSFSWPAPAWRVLSPLEAEHYQHTHKSQQKLRSAFYWNSDWGSLHTAHLFSRFWVFFFFCGLVRREFVSPWQGLCRSKMPSLTRLPSAKWMLRKDFKSTFLARSFSKLRCFVFKGKTKGKQKEAPLNQHESDWLNLNSFVSKTPTLLAELDWWFFLRDPCLHVALP